LLRAMETAGKLVEDEEMRDMLKLNGIGTLIQWGGKGIHQWEHVNFVGSLPNTENFFKHPQSEQAKKFIQRELGWK